MHKSRGKLYSFLEMDDVCITVIVSVLFVSSSLSKLAELRKMEEEE